MGLLKAKNSKSDIINIWMDMPESAILLKQWHDMKIPALPFGSTLAAAEQPGFWKATDGKGEYTLCNVVNAGNAPSNATPWTMKFYDAYTKRWGLEPEGRHRARRIARCRQDHRRAGEGRPDGGLRPAALRP
jgi:branched-chain amino acid transport system substrate-binding protein